MIEFIDPFGRNTIFEFSIAPIKNRIGFVIRKERQSVYESLDINVAKLIMLELQFIIKQMEENNDKEI
jgi:hypothetical protein